VLTIIKLYTISPKTSQYILTSHVPVRDHQGSKYEIAVFWKIVMGAMNRAF
jgi:hypothetical protein